VPFFTKVLIEIADTNLRSEPPGKNAHNDESERKNMTEQSVEPVKVLVVDDEEVILDLYSQILGPPLPANNDHLRTDESKNATAGEKNSGIALAPEAPAYNLTLCDNGNDAIAMVRQARAEDQPFAIAFIDVRMPYGLDGISTAEKIRTIAESTQIVIVTGFNDLDPTAIERRIPPANRLLYLQKPFHPFEIRQFASTLSARWKAEKMMHTMNRDLELIVEKRTRQLQKAYKQLEYHATHDFLTELLNRRAVLDILKKEISRFRRTDQPISVILGDLDHFKDVNDTYGHSVGDAVLKETAARLLDCVRPYDTVGRIGGEEFLIVLPECDTADGTAVAERIRIAIGQAEIDAAGKKICVTISLGVATASAHQMINQDSLVAAADKALYQAKKEGRNKIKLNTKINFISAA
jgi:diguanylate cyclase (GGDEF)-like protein